MRLLLREPTPQFANRRLWSMFYHPPNLLTLCSQSRYSDIRNIPQRTTSSDTAVKPAVKKDEPQQKPTSGAELPPVSTSKIDVNAVPIYKPVGKPITQVQVDQGAQNSLLAGLGSY